MKDGFIKVEAATPEIVLGNIEANTDRIVEMINDACERGVRVIVFPSMCLFGATGGDVAANEFMIEEVKRCVDTVLDATIGLDILVIVGYPMVQYGRFTPAVGVFNNGDLVEEIYDKRSSIMVNAESQDVAIGVINGVKLEDAADEVSKLAHDGATIIAHLNAQPSYGGAFEERASQIKWLSKSFACGYIYANAGQGESTTDNCYMAGNVIAENGEILAKLEHESSGAIISEIDCRHIITERVRRGTFELKGSEHIDSTCYVPCNSYTETLKARSAEEETVKLTRKYAKNPFLGDDKAKAKVIIDEAFDIQVSGLIGRMNAIRCKTVILGVSGGLDSTLALMVCAEAFKRLKLDPKGIIAVTMPCFGTSDRTHSNALKLIRGVEATFKEINIKKAVLQHFEDIGQDPEKADVTFENAQARERTQVLMDLANMYSGIVIGTGDLSELALGFATYNGDHMSMYGVNASIPKTMMQEMVRQIASKVKAKELKEALLDVVATPISPELLPSKKGETTQITEEVVGPYELHDFFVFHFVYNRFAPRKIYRIACETFKGAYEPAVILKWEKVFFRRFFAQQYKRSCMPDGPAATLVSLSPRGAWRMPSDIGSATILKELEEI